MGKRKDYTQYTAGASSVKTNYRIKLTIGKDLKRATIQDGSGFAKSQNEAESMYESIIKKTHGVLKAEFYFNNLLIKKK